MNYLYFLILVPLFLSGQEIGFSYNDLSYSKKSFVLDGKVKLEHPLGIVTTDHAELLNDHEKDSFKTLLLKKHVSVTFTEGGILNCEDAEIDVLNLKGLFKGNVSYRENEKKVNFSSQNMQVYLDDQKQSPENKKHLINKIAAQECVRIEYNQNFVAEADSCLYEKASSESGEKLNGYISLKASDEKRRCKVMNKHNDVIEASLINIDTIKGLLAFVFPKGKLHVERSNEELKEELYFSSDYMVWNDKENSLTLKGNGLIYQNGMGILNAEDEIVLTLKDGQGKQEIKTIVSKGNTSLTHQDDKNNTHTLTSMGSFILDHEHLKAFVEGPRDDFHNVLDGKQVIFKDNFGKVLADKLTLTYELIDNQPKVSKLILEGNVRVIDESKEQKADTHFQYAFADKLEYDFDSHEAYLSSPIHKRVLFFDKVNSLQVSAPGIRIKREGLQAKDSIKGEGDVRFSFIESEKSLLKHYFPESSF
jgi:lipopolysaccharide export system protein LptA